MFYFLDFSAGHSCGRGVIWLPSSRSFRHSFPFHHNPECIHMQNHIWSLYKESRIRKYTFHGTSYLYLTREAARMMQNPAEEMKIIALHWGAGAGVRAIKKVSVFYHRSRNGYYMEWSEYVMTHMSSTVDEVVWLLLLVVSSHVFGAKSILVCHTAHVMVSCHTHKKSKKVKKKKKVYESIAIKMKLWYILTFDWHWIHIWANTSCSMCLNRW